MMYNDYGIPVIFIIINIILSIICLLHRIIYCLQVLLYFFNLISKMATKYVFMIVIINITPLF